MPPRPARVSQRCPRAPTGRSFLPPALCAFLLALGVSACTRVPELGSFTHLLAQPEAGTKRGPFAAETGVLTLEHLQIKGTHNSYHQAPRMALTSAWKYSHLPLAKQLELQGVRQIELDVRYVDGEVVVGHLPMLDSRTSCRKLKTCLEQVRGWSVAHPDHLPIFVFIEPKEHLAPSNLDGRLEVLDRTIAGVFPRKSLLVPEQVAGSASSLQEAVATRGWPSLADARGKVVFVLFGRENHTRAYGRGRPRLEGRLMFAAGDPGDPYAAIASYDNPLEERAEIAEALSHHMLVRTRADGDLLKDRTRRDAALTSGAHFVGSDFVDPKLGWLELGDAARCNPRSAPTGCAMAALAESSGSPTIATAAGALTAAAAQAPGSGSEAVIDPPTTVQAPGTARVDVPPAAAIP
jgi:hypothetical protein